MSHFKYDLQDLFDNQLDDSKIKANIQFDFAFGELNERPLQRVKRCNCKNEDCACSSIVDGGEWMRVQQVVLSKTSNKQMMSLVKSAHNEFAISNKNMPFLFEKIKKLDKNYPKKLVDSRQANETKPVSEYQYLNPKLMKSIQLHSELSKLRDDSLNI